MTRWIREETLGGIIPRRRATGPPGPADEQRSVGPKGATSPLGPQGLMGPTVKIGPRRSMRPKGYAEQSMPQNITAGGSVFRWTKVLRHCHLRHSGHGLASSGRIWILWGRHLHKRRCCYYSIRREVL